MLSKKKNNGDRKSLGPLGSNLFLDSPISRKFFLSEENTNVKRGRELLEIVEELNELPKVAKTARLILGQFMTMTTAKSEVFDRALESALSSRSLEQMAGDTLKLQYNLRESYSPIVNSVIWLVISLSAIYVLGRQFGFFDFFDPTPLVEKGLEVLSDAIRDIVFKPVGTQTDRLIDYLSMNPSFCKEEKFKNGLPPFLKDSTWTYGSRNVTDVAGSDYSDLSRVNIEILNEKKNMTVSFILDVKDMTMQSYREFVGPYLAKTATIPEFFKSNDNSTRFNDAAISQRFISAANLNIPLLGILMGFVGIMEQDRSTFWTDSPVGALMITGVASALTLRIMYDQIASASSMFDIAGAAAQIATKLGEIWEYKKAQAVLTGAGMLGGGLLSTYSKFVSLPLKSAMQLNQYLDVFTSVAAGVHTVYYYNTAKNSAILDFAVQAGPGMVLFLTGIYQFCFQMFFKKTISAFRKGFGKAFDKSRVRVPQRERTDQENLTSSNKQTIQYSRDDSYSIAAASQRLEHFARLALSAKSNNVELAAELLAKSGVFF